MYYITSFHNFSSVAFAILSFYLPLLLCCSCWCPQCSFHSNKCSSYFASTPSLPHSFIQSFIPQLLNLPFLLNLLHTFSSFLQFPHTQPFLCLIQTESKTTVNSPSYPSLLTPPQHNTFVQIPDLSLSRPLCQHPMFANNLYVCSLHFGRSPFFYLVM